MEPRQGTVSFSSEAPAEKHLNKQLGERRTTEDTHKGTQQIITPLMPKFYPNPLRLAVRHFLYKPQGLFIVSGSVVA